MRRLLPALLPVALGAAGCTLPPPYPVVPAGMVGTAGRPYDLIGPYDAAAVQAPRRFDARPLPPPPPPGPLDLVPFDPSAPPPRQPAARPDPDQVLDPDTAPSPATTAATGSTARPERPAMTSAPAASSSTAPASTAASRTPTGERGTERSSAVPLEGFRPLGGVSRRSQPSY